MRRSEVLQEVRLLDFEEVYGQFQKRRLSCGEAAELSGASVKTFPKSKEKAAPDHDPPCLTGLAVRHLPKGVARNSRPTGLT